MRMLFLSITVSSAVLFCADTSQSVRHVTCSQDVWRLFDVSPQDVVRQTDDALLQAEALLKKTLDIPSRKRTFANTCQTLDTLTHGSSLAILGNRLRILLNTHPDEPVRSAAEENKKKIDAYYIDLWSNSELYQAVLTYSQHRHDACNATAERNYYIGKTLHKFEQSGAHLPPEDRGRVHSLLQEIDLLCKKFLSNVGQDVRFFEASEDALQGMSSTFLASLPRTESGAYTLLFTRPNFTQILSSCTVESTRKQIYEGFVSKAYPANEEVLREIMHKRHTYARLLGYQTFAHLDIADQTAKTPERVKEFLERLCVRGKEKYEEERKQLIAYVPASITLADGKIKPWDIEFVKNAYLNQRFNFDQNEFSAYFPLDRTLAGMFEVYGTLFSLEMSLEDAAGSWHEDVKLVRVCKKGSSELLGHIILDLFPRDKKFSHFWSMPVVPAVTNSTTSTPAVAVVIGNFPKPSRDVPSLLFLDFGGAVGGLVTLFHEFGHALHEVLSQTELASSSGMNVPLDFIEMPSMVLERLPWEPIILKTVSSHYVTGDRMPEDLIAKVKDLKHVLSGQLLLKFISGARVALELFGEPTSESLFELHKRIKETGFSHLLFSDEDHSYASFIHAVDMYFSKYYSYAWSNVLAADLFAKIKECGVLDPGIGDRYRELVLSRGGSADPGTLLRSFLGREPSDQAFFADMGLGQDA